MRMKKFARMQLVRWRRVLQFDLRMKNYRLIIFFCLFSCSSNNVDPIKGSMNVFDYDGILYHTPGGAYGLYNKINGSYYYYFLIGTTGQFQQPGTINIAGASVTGNYVRVLLVADSLDKFYGEYSIDYNNLNIVKVDNNMDTLKEGKIILSKGVNEILQIEIRATSKSNKMLDLRAELTTGGIAFRVYRKVKGSFQLQSNIYDLARSTAVLKSEPEQSVITFEDDNDIFASQIAFYVNDTDKVLDATYPNNSGYVSVFDYSKNETIYRSDFGNASISLVKNQNGYNTKFKIKTLLGDSVNGNYSGNIELF